ncbi:hypothetical protein JCM30471_34570 [Desulfuromonas carbonis]|uniref:hypothetical protein n=1 Tax=Desulfuromonas sp. DDH964 TaxID=1823759 RepID=UPI00078E85B8|nr:hypothetical protein [Desulfuromonas sp. DDH964]AMV71931.1 hypothetical protein DBW_1569 [Desulfuromonas sp. DDH964]
MQRLNPLLLLLLLLAASPVEAASNLSADHRFWAVGLGLLLGLALLVQVGCFLQYQLRRRAVQHARHARRSRR